MPPTDQLDVPLTDIERRLLVGGVSEWGGPARCTEDFAVAMGFRSLSDFYESRERLTAALRGGESLSQIDWVRVLLMTEIAFASDVVGSGWDWQSTVGISDQESIRVLRSIQRKIPRAGVMPTYFGRGIDEPRS